MFLTASAGIWTEHQKGGASDLKSNKNSGNRGSAKWNMNGKYYIQSVTTMSMKNVSTGVIDKTKNRNKAKNLWYIITYHICQNTNKKKIYIPLCQTYIPTIVCISISKKCTKIQQASDFHDPKRHKDNQLQKVIQLRMLISK